MNEERRRLGRGLGALIPSGPASNIDRVLDLTDSGDRAARRSGRTPQAAGEPGSTAGTPVGLPQPAAAASDRAQPPVAAAGRRPEPAAAPRAEATAPAVYRELRHEQISPNPRQPRTVFDTEAMAELVTSIRTVGLLQPIVVRQTAADQFEIVAGERRWRACQEAGIDPVPVIVRETSDDELLREALLENLHRADLNPLEEAAAYQQMMRDFGCTQEDLARRVARSRPQVSNTLRLLRLPAKVQRRVAAGVLSAGHARALLALEDPEAMDALAARIVTEGLSVRQVEEIVALGDVPAPGNPRRRRSGGGQGQPVEIVEAARRMGDRLETRVKVAMGARKGRISIEFATVDDLARIVEVIEGRPLTEDPRLS